MSFRKTHDLAVKVGSYTGSDGKDKGRYENVGHILMDGDKKLLLLKRTFNPAGVVNPDGRDTVILSVFEVKERDGNAGGHDWKAAEARERAAQPAREPAPAADDLNDSIPFAFAYALPAGLLAWAVFAAAAAERVLA